MRVFVTGAAGWVGSHVVKELLSYGHRVLGLARSDANAAVLTALGAEVHRGSLEDVESLKQGALACDGVIHCGFIHDFARFQQCCATDRVAIETIGAALAGSNKPFVSTFGTLGTDVAPGSVGTEEHPGMSTGMAGLRAGSEAAVLATAANGVRATLIRLPPSVHGTGDGGFVPTLIAMARQHGSAVYIGEGHNRWPSVHVLDAVRLYRLALEKGQAGSRFHAVADEGVPTRDIAEAIGRGLGVPVVSQPVGEASAFLGFLTHFFAMDAPSSSRLTQERLGWKPTEPGLIDDLGQGHYFDTTISSSKYIQ